jgi:hypothetical protein
MESGRVSQSRIWRNAIEKAMPPRETNAFRLPCAPMTQGPAFRFARLRLAVPFAALFLTACPPPPPPPAPKVETPPPVANEPAPPPLAPSRWMESKGNTLVGPTLAEGTLVLLGGRRVLVGKDGTAKSETVAAPEGLLGFTEVTNGAGARKVIAYSEHAVYRLDDLLGEPKTLARTDGEVWKVSAGPGAVVVWDFDSDVPRFIDVDSGQLKTVASLPAVPANAMAFKNAKEGAGIFEAVGLAITTDGGATWKPAGETAKGDATRVIDLKLRGDTVFASLGYGRSDVPLDFAAGKLGTAVEAQIPTTEAPLLKWIRRTERDPLGEAAQGGVLLPSGEGLIAAMGLLARVDMKTGLVNEVVEVAGEEARACSVVRGGDSAWLGCSLPESEANEELYDPFGVYRIPLTGGKIAPDRAVLKRSGDAEIRTAPSGGVMVLGGCGPEGGRDEMCVRQADGKWASVRTEVDVYERGAGPLSDGRVAYIRGIYEGEDPPEDVAPPPSSDDGERPEGASSGGRKAWIVAMDSNGKERTLATLSLTSSEATDLSVRGYVQEGEDKRLHVVLMTEEGPSIAIATPGKQPVEPQKVQGASAVKLAGNNGIAMGDGKLLGSTDGGATWAEIPAPKRIGEMIGGSEEGRGYLEDYILVSDAGLKAEQFMRLGWGTQEALPEDRQPTGGITLQRPPAPPTSGPERTMACTTDGAGQGAAPLNSAYQVQDFFVKGTPAKGTKRKSSGSPGGRFGMLDAIGALSVEGPEKAGALPAKWNFFWYDPSEIGGKTKSVSAPAPKDASWDISMRSVASFAGRTIFSFRSGTKNLIARTKGAGIETAEVTYDLMPSMEVVFGTDKGEPIVWMSGSNIVAWLTGEQPRIVATITGRATRALGQPNKDGIPVLLTSTSWGLVKIVPIPALDKKDKNAKPTAHPQSIWLEGWTPVANYRRDLSRLPACAKGAKGYRVVTSRYSGTVNIDGVDESTQMAAYDLRVNGNDVCVATVMSFLSPMSRMPAPPKDAKPPKPGAAVPGPVAFLRYDLVANKAEGGDRGIPKDPPKGAPKPPPPVRKLTCKYEEKK